VATADADRSSAAPGPVRVRFVSHPHSVRTARQLVTDTLRTWRRDGVVDDARLVVTELATNATLHSGSDDFHVCVVATSGDGVRIAVGDDGDVPAAAVVRRPARSAASDGTRPETTTGRGLAIVDHLSAAWGVTVDDGRRWVWAQLSGDDEPDAVPEAVAGPAAPSGELPSGWHAVRLARCPVGLGLAQDEHLDELVRELQLVAAPSREPELAAVIRGLLDGQAQARHMGRRTAQDAAAAGREHVDVEMLLPSVAAEQVERLDDAVVAADALCEGERLLTLASSPQVRSLRTWMREEVAEQIRRGRAPRSYDDFLAGTAGGASSRTA
jgi:anti-sigma regulatory factor (Ser/Thr protein kinase)